MNSEKQREEIPGISLETRSPRAGVVFVLLSIQFLILSLDFHYGSPMTDRPILATVFTLIIMGTVYFYLAGDIVKGLINKKGFNLLLLLGLVMRIVMLFSNPVLEDDFYRYLWDGGVTAAGINPYRPVPEQVWTGEYSGPTADRLLDLSLEAGIVLERVNHPHLRTVYPPVSQLFFAVSHILFGWSFLGLKLVWLIVDIFALIILAAVLRRLGIAQYHLLIYWLNPVLIKEVYNSGHMDILLVPVVLGMVYFSLTWRPVVVGVLGGIGIGVKVWPVLLVPLLLKRAARNWRGFLAGTLSFLMVSLLVTLPVVLTGLGRDSGFEAYSKQWEMNDLFYMVVLWGVEWVSKLGLGLGDPQQVTRGIVMLVLLVAVLVTFRKSCDDDLLIVSRLLLVSALLFFLSPTQFPWYFLWVLPLLALVPFKPVLLLTVLLPLYYSRFFFNAIDAVDLFDYGVVWVEWLPPLILLLFLWYKKKTVKEEGGCSVRG